MRFSSYYFSLTFAALLLYLVLSGYAPHSATISSGLHESREFFSKEGFSGILALAFAFLFGETMIPPYASRALASRNEGVAKKSFVLAGLFSFAWFFVVTQVGFLSRSALGPEVESDSVLLQSLSPFPPFVTYFFGIVLLGVVMSSLDSLLNSGGVSFSEDILARLIRHKPDRRILNWSRLGLVLIAGLGCLGGIESPVIDRRFAVLLRDVGTRNHTFALLHSPGAKGKPASRLPVFVRGFNCAAPDRPRSIECRA